MSSSSLSCEQIATMVTDEFADDSQVNVDTDGYYFNIQVISARFDGLNTVKRQQLVYKGLQQAITSGSLHAVNIKTYTPLEWQEARV